MKLDALALLPEYVLGALPEPARREVAAAVAASPALAAEVDRLTEALAALAAAAPAVVPAPAVRARLLETLGGVNRFAPFLPELGRLLDLPLDAVRAVLAGVDDAAAWEAGLPGTELQHFAAGPRLASADAGFVRLAPGVTFPRHDHLGQEITFVLEGAMREGGRVYGPGAVLEKRAGDVHDYAATPERPLVVVLFHFGIVPVF